MSLEPSIIQKMLHLQSHNQSERKFLMQKIQLETVQIYNKVTTTSETFIYTEVF